MARITVEDCLQKVNNRFALIHMASKRVRQLRKGAEPKITAKNRDIVVSLREIAAGYVQSVSPSEYDLLPEGEADAISEEQNVETQTTEEEISSSEESED